MVSILLGGAALVAGIWLLAGLGWALVAMGVEGLGAGVLLYDPNPEEKPIPREVRTGQKPMVTR